MHLSSIVNKSKSQKQLVQVEFLSSTTWTVPSGVGLVFVSGCGGGASGTAGGIAGSDIVVGANGAKAYRIPITVKNTLPIIVGTGGAAVYPSWTYWYGNYIWITTPGNPGGATRVGDIVIPGGGMTGNSSAVAIPFDTRNYIYYSDKPLYSPGNTSRPVLRPNGGLAQVTPGSSYTGAGGNATNYYTDGLAYSQPGSSGYVMLEYFI